MRNGSGGPCDHCGRTASPCWRKGPVEKPLLCNACGARYLVKRNLEGYLPGAKPSCRHDSPSGSSTSKPRARNPGLFTAPVTASSLHSHSGADGKRKRKAVKRFEDDSLMQDMGYQDYASPQYFGENPDSPVRRANIVRRHKNGKTTVDRGTQTTIVGRLKGSSEEFIQNKRSKLFTLHANAELQIRDEEFSQLAVSTLALLSRSTAVKSEPAPPLFAPRRRRKPAKPTMRTLF